MGMSRQLHIKEMISHQNDRYELIGGCSENIKNMFVAGHRMTSL